MSVTLLSKWQALVAAIADGRLSPRAKLVFAVLLDCLNTKSGRCVPGQATIAQRVGSDVRAVRRALRELRIVGYIVSKRRRGTASYSLNLERTEMSSLNGTKSGQICPPRADTRVLSDRTEMSSPYMNMGIEHGKRAWEGPQKRSPKAKPKTTIGEEW